MGTHSVVASWSWASCRRRACWAWMEPVCAWASKALPCYWLWDPEGRLSYAAHLDNLRSQGQHSEGRLKHLEKPSLWQAHISPSGPPLPLPRGLSPGRKCLCLYLIPNPPHPTLSLDGEQRDAAHTNPSLMACHGGHKCPAVRLRVVHLHRA